MRRQKSMEVRMETSFGEVRIDNMAKQPYLEQLNPDKFWKVIHAHSQVADESFRVNTRRGRKQKEREKRAAPTSFDVPQPDASGKIVTTHDENVDYFDEVYFGHIPPGEISQPSSGGKDTVYPDNGTKDAAPNRTSDLVGHMADDCHSKQTVVNISNTNVKSSATPDSLFDETYFATALERTEHPAASQRQSPSSDASFIDQQYFPETLISEENVTQTSQQTFGHMQVKKTPESKNSAEECNVIDSQYVSTSGREISGHSSSFDHLIGQYNVMATESSERTHTHRMPSELQENFSSQKLNSAATPATHSKSIKEMKAQGLDVAELPRQLPIIERKFLDGDNAFRQERIPELGEPVADSGKTTERQRIKVRGQLQSMDSAVQRGTEDADEDHGETAYDVAMKMRKEINSRGQIGTDDGLSQNKQRLILIKEQVPDLYNMPSSEITRLLANSVIYENDDFIAIAKPYGLPSHGGPGVRVSVGQLLEPLAQCLDKGRHQFASLHLIHRLDKETTGVMLLGKNAEVAWQLLGMFRRREVKKKYWAVTKGVPRPLEGIIDIPLARQKVHGIFKTIITPEKFVACGEVKTQQWSHRSNRSMEAVTEYEILAHHNNMALVELRPLTGVQHQIRVHLAQALNTPILGDHKYSHMDKLAPQRLFPEALQKLGLRQAQVRYLPTHLHAKSLVLPEWRGRNNIFINAPVPKFFLSNLNTLKIKIPKK